MPAVVSAPARVRIVVAAVAIAGAAAFAGAAPGVLTGARPAGWLVLVGLLAVATADIPALDVRFGTEHYSFTWAEAAVVVGIVALPPAWFCLLAPIGVGASHAVARRPAMKVAYNAAAAAVGAFLATSVIDAVSGPGAIVADEPRTWVALTVAAATYFTWNHVAISAVVAASRAVPFLRVWRTGLLLAALVAAGNTFLGVCLVAMAATSGSLLVFVPAILGLLFVLYRSYHQAMQERDTWQLLQDSSRDLLQTDHAELAAVVARSAIALFTADLVELVVVPDRGGPARSFTRTSDPTSGRDRSGRPEELAGPYWGRASCERLPFLVRREDAPPPQHREMIAADLERVLVAPLLQHDGCIGMLRVGFTRAVRLRPRDLQVFSTFANHISGAVQNVQLFDDIRHQALHDPLTGLPNRVLLLDRLDQALARAKRHGTQIALLFFDLDRFKVINDSLGHEIGDELLVAVADRIAANLRDGDTATRFGGDEFVVLCEEVDDAPAARAVADRLLETLREPFTVAGQTAVVTASVGVALSSSDGDAGSLIRDADTAMYRAKAERSGCEVFDAGMRATIVARLDIENELRAAIDGGDLRLHYQPVIDLGTQCVASVEALVRWEHPDRGIVAPDQFIPVAEETGLIVPLGMWVLEEACRQLAEWQHDPDFRGLGVAVNLSPHQLVHPGVVEMVRSVLRRTGAPPGRLSLEITESALLQDIHRTLHVLRGLRDIGVRIALDDFGTGYSSLSYLHELPVDTLKIDRSFIVRLGDDVRDRAIVAGMIGLAHTLDLDVIAEGVETTVQLGELSALGCDAAQGYYFARPAPAGQLRDWMRGQRIAESVTAAFASGLA